MVGWMWYGKCDWGLVGDDCVMLSIVCGDVCGITLVDGLGVLGEGCMVVN